MQLPSPGCKLQVRPSQGVNYKYVPPQGVNYKYSVSQILRHTLCAYDILHQFVHSNILTMTGYIILSSSNVTNVNISWQISISSTLAGAPSVWKYTYHHYGGNASMYITVKAMFKGTL